MYATPLKTGKVYFTPFLPFYRRFNNHRGDYRVPFIAMFIFNCPTYHRYLLEEQRVGNINCFSVQRGKIQDWMSDLVGPSWSQSSTLFS